MKQRYTLQQKRKLFWRWEGQCNIARCTMMAIAGASAAGVAALLFFGSGFFGVTALLPYLLVQAGMVLCGKLPTMDVRLPLRYMGGEWLYIMLGGAVLVLLTLFLCGLFGGRQGLRWSVTGPVLYLADTVLLVYLYGGAGSLWLLLVLRCLVLFLLWRGLYAVCRQLDMLEECPGLEQPVSALPEKTVYLIGGPMGVGKTTVSRHLQALLPNCVMLDGDWCWDAAPFTVTEETREMVVDNIRHLLRNFADCSAYQNIVLCWVMQEQSCIDALREGLEDCNVKVISLLCTPEALEARLQKDIAAGLRTPDVIGRSMERLPLFGDVQSMKVDTTHKTAQQVAAEIGAM